MLNVRVEDWVHEGLKERADGEGVTLSEYVRDLLLAEVSPVHQPPGDQAAAESLSIRDRQLFALLHRILGRVLPDDANDVDGDRDYQLERAEILEQGFTREYRVEVAGFRTELSVRDCDRVNEILTMFSVLTHSLAQLDPADRDDDLVRRLQYRGFDHNDPLESHMAAYVRYQLQDEDNWPDLRAQIAETDRGNSHAPTLQAYLRMLSTYRKIMAGRQERIHRQDYLLLSREDLQQIADAKIHPSRR